MKYEKLTIRMTPSGVDLKSALDALPKDRFRILTNVTPQEEQGIMSRPGTRRISTGASPSPIHSLGYLYNGSASASLLAAGASTSVYNGLTGVSLASGFSGNPLTFAQYRLSGSSSPWLIVADSKRMVKISPFGTVQQLGITPPASAASASVGTPYTTAIDAFSADSGYVYLSSANLSAPSHTTISGAPPGGNAIQMTDATASTLGYYAISRVSSVNLSVFSGGPATQPTDYISLWVNVNDPSLIQEIRILFSLDAGGVFTGNYYWASIRTSDIQAALDFQETVSAQANSIGSQLTLQQLLGGVTAQTPYSASNLLGAQISPGQNQWTQLFIPLGSFERSGASSSTWANVTGYGVFVVTAATATASNSIVAVSSLALTGGYGANSIPAGVAYDYRYTYYNSSTQSESNPSPVMAAGVSVRDAPVTVTASGSGDPQVTTIRFYRRGGALPSNWYLTGASANASGNVQFIDSSSDSAIASAPVLVLTNDRPFTTISASNITLYGVPLPFIFGPYGGNVIFALGDPNRPGFLYWFNSGNPDGASSINNVEISQPSDPLSNGVMWQDVPFVFTGLTAYRILPNQIGVPNQFVGIPTGCQHGLVSPYAIVATPVGIWFVSNDGVYVMSGGPETLMSLDLWPLFNTLSAEIYAPIDFTQTSKIQMAYFDNEVWFGYQDTLGAQQWWTTNVFKRDGWRNRTYPWPAISLLAQPEGVQQLLLGGADGNVYAEDYAVSSDAGQAIPCHVRTGSFNAGFPALEKEFGSLILDGNTGLANVSVNVLYAYETITSAIGNFMTNQRSLSQYSLSDTYYFDAAFDFQWASSSAVRLYSAMMMWRPDEIPDVHFESPHEGFGVGEPASGAWAHVYDGYVMLRSTAPVNLTLVADGVTLPVVTLPSTGGARSKLYVQLPLNKGKAFRTLLDTSVAGVPFRVYIEDTFLNLIPWANGEPAQVRPLEGL